MKNIKVIAFDADDTLWVNETYFREAELEFAGLLQEFGDREYLINQLFLTEFKNIPFYGYGIKGFTLSLLETAIKVSEQKVSAHCIQQLIDISKNMIRKPVDLLDGVEEVLNHCKQKGYKILVATKGDLLDQQRKLKKSKLESYFHHIEIMTDKKEEDYLNLLARLEILPQEFLMIGNSPKSDILPVVGIGGHAIHIPFHTTWQHEQVENLNQHNIVQLKSIKELISMIK